jgi:DNA-binding transcriptional LysR family regulator
MNTKRAQSWADLAPEREGGHGHPMEMHQIRYFLAVADALYFTRAAEQCNVSQPALTRAIQQLEEELGGLLLRRERKLTHLTDFGRLIEPHFRQLYADADAAKSTAKRFLSLQEAEIRLGVMCTVGPARFMGFLPISMAPIRDAKSPSSRACRRGSRNCCCKASSTSR